MADCNCTGASDTSAAQDVYMIEEKVIKSRKKEYGQDNTVVQKLNTKAEKEMKSEKLQFKYEICRKEISTKYNLMTHVCYKGEKLFTCSACKKEFTQKDELNQHTQSVHSDESLDSCIKIADKSSKPYTCPICLETFSSQSLLNDHVNLHPEEKAFSCCDCDESFFEEQSFRAHRKIHSKEKKFCCDVCSKKFTSKSYLSTHLRLHTGDKPFSCTVCETRFAWKSGLAYHYRREHKHSTANDAVIPKLFTINKKEEIKSKNGDCILDNAAVSKLISVEEIKCENWNCIPDNAVSKLISVDEIEEIKCENGDCIPDNAAVSKLISMDEIEEIKCENGDCIPDNAVSKLISIDEIEEIKSENKDCIPDNAAISKLISIEEIKSENGEGISDNAAIAEFNIIDKKEKSDKLEYKCDVCDLEFTNKCHLKSHVCYHTVEKPFTCDASEKECTQKDEITQHIQSAHSGEKQCSCIMHSEHFSQKNSLDNHANVAHTGPKPFSDIEKKYTQKGEITQHIHSGEKQFSRILCTRHFYRKDSLQRHVNVALTRSGPNSSPLCKESFTHKNLLNEHAILHPKEKALSYIACHESFFEEKRANCCIHSGRKFSCEICSKKFTHKYALLAHIQLHTGEEPYSCDVHQTQSTQESGLTRHYRQKHSKEEVLTYSSKSETAQLVSDNAAVPKLVIIDEIEIKSETADYLPDTAELSNKDDEKLYTCNVCQQQFAQRSHLVTHHCLKHNEKKAKASNKSLINKHVNLHTKEKTFSCNVCQKSFFRKSTLKIHHHIHSKERKFSCDVCSKKFTSKCKLRIHIRLHTGKKTYACNVCQKQFTSKYNLLTHIRLHTGEKPYTCYVCQRQFTAKYNLLTHIRLHTGEKPYTCDVCQKQFTHKRGLSSHFSFKHTSSKAFSCEKCLRTFSEKKSFINHICVPPGEKPFKCDVCSRTFSRNCHLSLHKRISHYIELDHIV